MANTIYSQGLAGIISGNIRLESDTIVAMLTGSGYTPNIDDVLVSAIASNEAENDVGTGYERKVVSNKQFTIDAITDNVLFSCEELRWTEIKTVAPVTHIILFRQGFGDDTSTLLFAYEFASTTTVGADLLIKFIDNIAINVTRTP
jgi:hypothetical protein